MYSKKMYILTFKEAETFKVLFSKHNFVFKIAMWVIAVLCPTHRNISYENIAEGNLYGGRETVSVSHVALIF